MSEEVNPTFKKCLVKKSKSYYRTEALVVGMVILGTIFIAAACWVQENFQLNYTILLLVAFDFVVIGSISFGIAIKECNPVERFLKLFIGLHVAIVTATMLILLEVIAYFFLPTIVIFLVSSLLITFDRWIMLIGTGVGLLVILPVNHAIFVCSKIDAWINNQMSKLRILLV